MAQNANAPAANRGAAAFVLADKSQDSSAAPGCHDWPGKDPITALIASLKAAADSGDDLTIEDIHVALDDVADLVRRGALSVGEAGK